MKNSDDFFLCRLVVANASFLTLREKLRLLSNFRALADSRGTDFVLNELLNLNLSKISLLVGRKFKNVDWDAQARLLEAKKSYKILCAFGISSVFFGEKEYPSLLKTITDPPFSIFYRGNIKSLFAPCLSIVGSRRADFESQKETEDFAFKAASDGITVVSGLAFGVDVCAHKGALRSAVKGKGSTVAILAGGIDEITPKSHTRIAQKILENGGAILSEYTPGTGAAPWRFVHRNRLIAALSRATVVMQSPPGSGALYTASFALDYNRELFFHSSNFTNSANALSSAVRLKMKKSVAATCSTVNRFVDEGAPIISSYDDFLNKISHSNQN